MLPGWRFPEKPLPREDTMIRSLGLIAVVGLLAGPVGARAQETYTIKVKKGADGETTREEKHEEGDVKIKIEDLNGNGLGDHEEKSAAEYVYKQTILEKKP